MGTGALPPYWGYIESGGDCGKLNAHYQCYSVDCCQAFQVPKFLREARYVAVYIKSPDF